MRAQAIDVDYLARYQWVAQFAAGRRVLDANCGAGAGCRLLAEAGAREVIGLNSAKSVAEAGMPQMPDRVQLDVGDLRSLQYPDGAFDLVVCLDTIAPGEEGIDELVRVLADEGLLVISTFEREAPLDRALPARLSNTRIWRQFAYLGSAISGGADGIRDRGDQVEVRTLRSPKNSSPTCLIALASRRSLPQPIALLGLTDRLEFGEWVAALDAAEERLRSERRLVQRLRDEQRDRVELQDRLLETEQRLASVPALEQRNSDLLGQLADRELELQALTDQLLARDQIVQEIISSPSWRITEPLRLLKRTLRR
jgi:SAM-dependent methyltransferase